MLSIGWVNKVVGMVNCQLQSIATHFLSKKYLEKTGLWTILCISNFIAVWVYSLRECKLPLTAINQARNRWWFNRQRREVWRLINFLSQLIHFKGKHSFKIHDKYCRRINTSILKNCQDFELSLLLSQLVIVAL